MPRSSSSENPPRHMLRQSTISSTGSLQRLTPTELVYHENMKSNDHIGPTVCDKTHDSVIRMYFGNPNGLTINANGGEFSEAD
jgi:hypothetical protein